MNIIQVLVICMMFAIFTKSQIVIEILATKTNTNDIEFQILFCFVVGWWSSIFHNKHHDTSQEF